MVRGEWYSISYRLGLLANYYAVGIFIAVCCTWLERQNKWHSPPEKKKLIYSLHTTVLAGSDPRTLQFAFLDKKQQKLKKKLRVGVVHVTMIAPTIYQGRLQLGGEWVTQRAEEASAGVFMLEG